MDPSIDTSIDVFRAIVLGVVQGFTEPLPISSSGHLILTPWLLGWPSHTLTFDVALHAGTAVAFIAYFWRDYLSLAGAFIAGVFHLNFTKDRQRMLALYIVVASAPGAVAGVLFEDKIEEFLRAPLLVAAFLILMGAVLMLADSISSRSRGIGDLRFWDALLIGVSQAFALAPGVSRSGVTITAARFLGLGRADAARFSFLLSGPIVSGAAIYKLGSVARQGFPEAERLPFLLGALVAAVVGYIAIRFLLSYLQRNSLSAFAYYRFALGALIFGLFVLRGFTL